MFYILLFAYTGTLYPAIGIPVFTGPLLKNNGDRFAFECRITGYTPSGNHAERFEIVFMVDGVDFMTHILFSWQLKYGIDDGDLVGQAGKTVKMIKFS